jgi:hypothetical protein
LFGKQRIFGRLAGKETAVVVVVVVGSGAFGAVLQVT